MQGIGTLGVSHGEPGARALDELTDARLAVPEQRFVACDPGLLQVSRHPTKWRGTAPRRWLQQSSDPFSQVVEPATPAP